MSEKLLKRIHSLNMAIIEKLDQLDDKLAAYKTIALKGMEINWTEAIHGLLTSPNGAINSKAISEKLDLLESKIDSLSAELQSIKNDSDYSIKTFLDDVYSKLKEDPNYKPFVDLNNPIYTKEALKWVSLPLCDNSKVTDCTGCYYFQDNKCVHPAATANATT